MNHIRQAPFRTDRAYSRFQLWPIAFEWNNYFWQFWQPNRWSFNGHYVGDDNGSHDQRVFRIMFLIGPLTIILGGKSPSRTLSLIRYVDREFTTCVHCGHKAPNIERASMTMYHWDEKSGEPDPNRVDALCDRCYQEYCDHWQSMWDEYNSGRL